MEIKRLDKNGKVTQAFYEYSLQCCKDGIEIWVDIDGYKGMYQVSNFGKVKSLSRQSWNGAGWFTKEERILSPNMGTNGYLSVQVCKNGGIRRREIHRLESMAFIPNPENKATVNHKNGIKTDNLLTNYEWATYKENGIHAFVTGLTKGGPVMFGKDNPISKDIYRYDLNGNYIDMFHSAGEATRKLGINTCCIGDCARGRQKTSGGYKWSYELQT